jgi:hypothetical protein
MWLRNMVPNPRAERSISLLMHADRLDLYPTLSEIRLRTWTIFRLALPHWWQDRKMSEHKANISIQDQIERSQELKFEPSHRRPGGPEYDESAEQRDRIGKALGTAHVKAKPDEQIRDPHPRLIRTRPL